MWCPECKAEYREGIAVCADCGAALVEHLETEEAGFGRFSDQVAEEVLAEGKEQENMPDFLHASGQQAYVKYADRYQDIKSSGMTFLVFGIIGVLYLALSKAGVIPLQYNIVVFGAMAALFAAFLFYGAVSLGKASKIKGLISEEESRTLAMKEWLAGNLTEDLVASWSDREASEGENDLLVTARIKEMLWKEYSEEPKEYLEMVADEYYEEHFYGKA